MSEPNYERVREAILDYWEKYVRSPQYVSGDPTLIALSDRISGLKNGKFVLAVVGEVNAGKSTFINALLGREVLASNCLQCTSAIVEVIQSEKEYVRVLYADGHEELVYDDLDTPDLDEAAERLSQICSVKEKYRSIPTTVIDGFLIAGVRDVSLEELERKSCLRLSNKEYLVREYISEYSDLKQIPVEVSFGIPFPRSITNLRIVDTPGVNAVGGIQDKTKDYIGTADAIIFVHRIKPVESQSLRGFFEAVASNYKRENLFLILTRSAFQTAEEIHLLTEEACRLYPEIDQRNIIALDSMLKIIADDLASCSLTAIDRNESKQRILKQFGYNPNDLGKGKQVATELLAESNFETVNQILADLSRNAKLRQLVSIVDAFEERVIATNSELANSRECIEGLYQLRAALTNCQPDEQGLICFGGRDGVFFVELLSGKQVWKYETEATVTSRALIHSGILVFGCYDGILYGVDISQRTERWRLEVGEKNWEHLIISNGTIFVGALDQHLYAIEADTGSLKWRFKTKGRVMSTPVTRNGAVFFGSYDGRVYAVDIETGNLIWQFDKKDWRCVSPTVLEGAKSF
jgi:GTPase SAR1 family protein